MAYRICRTEDDVVHWHRFLSGLTLPITVTSKAGADRTRDQNALLWKWNGEIAAQAGDRTAQDVHSENKLIHGVAIRKTEDEFRDIYDRLIRPLEYAEKIALMGPPIDLPVTRDMGVRQMSQFMDAVYADWTERGYVLTLPPPL